MFCLSTRTDSIDNRTFYQCPKCSTWATYFTCPPVSCNHCGYPLPNAKDIEKSQDSRYSYYLFAKY